jgi:hypothetical protein
MDSNTEPTPIAGTQPPAQAAGTQGAETSAGATPAASPAVVLARPARRDPLPIVLALAALVAVGGLSFAGGRLTAPAAAVTGLPGTGQRGGQGNGQQGNGQGNGFGTVGRALGAGVAIKGTIAAVAADHITLRLDNGQTLVVPVDTGTTYHRQASATSADVTTGAPVLVQMASNAGGGAGPVAPNASNAPGAIGRFIGTARDITILAQ